MRVLYQTEGTIQSMASSTALSLYNAVGILDDLLQTTANVALCDNCNGKFDDGITWNICTGPVSQTRTEDSPPHNGHTACTTCAMDPYLYIEAGGACRPWMISLGGRRSSVSKAGVALRPPVKNSLGTNMVNCVSVARERVVDAQESQDNERRQEGTDRRAAAVEDVRRRKQQEVDHLQREAERIREETRLAQEKAMEETRLAQEKAREEAMEETRLAQEKARERVHLEAEEFANRIARDNVNGATGSTRKRKLQTKETIERRIEASRATREAKKLKLEQYDVLVVQNETLALQISKVREIARKWMLSYLPSDIADETVTLMDGEIQVELNRIMSADEDGVDELAMVR